MAVSNNYYYTELKNEWPKLYDIKDGHFISSARDQFNDVDFFLDIIDTSAKISEFSVENIGRRTVVINDDSINCIFEPIYPDVVFIETNTEDTDKLRTECENKRQTYVQVKP
jgi:hypothetical protein